MDEEGEGFDGFDGEELPDIGPAWGPPLPPLLEPDEDWEW